MWEWGVRIYGTLGVRAKNETNVLDLTWAHNLFVKWV